MKIIILKSFVRYFLISFPIYLVILIIQFLSRYSDDVFNKGFSASDIAKLMLHTSLSMLGFSLLFGFLMAAMFSFKFYSSHRLIEFKKELTGGSIIMIFIAFLFFGYNNWLLPKSALEMRTLLYEMTSTAPGEKIQRVDKNLFKDNHATMTIKNINLKIDTFNVQINTYRHQCDSVLALLPDSFARDSYRRLALADYGIKYSAAKADSTSERDIINASNYLEHYSMNIKRTIDQKQKYVKEKTNRIILPIELLLLFMIGASFGFVYNDQKGFLLVILGIYTSAFFYQNEQLITQQIFGNMGGTIFSMLILLTVTIIFLIKGLKKEKELRSLVKVYGS